LKLLLQVSHRSFSCALSPPLLGRTGDPFIVYPAMRALEITSPYRHEAAEALQRVVRNMKPSFYFRSLLSRLPRASLEISNIVLRVHS
jgi:hypothetical protein